jgi:hypothetical protein
MFAGRLIIAVCQIVIVGATTMAADAPRRAAPPTWTPEVLDAFFTDAREALEGERPKSATTSHAATNDTGAGEAFAWSRVVSADTLDTEVKHIANALAEPLASAAAFKAGGNKQCHASFSLLAVLWAVIDEYDGDDVRWRRDAAALRGSFARAARACRTASDEAFTEAAERRAELNDLIRGGRTAGGDVATSERWSDIAARKPLMQRMQTAVQERINPAMSDAPTFTRAAVDVEHEAQMLVLLAEVIRRREYEYWDDETFNEYADELSAAAGELSRAAASGDYEAARAAAGRAAQACVTCHDGYRG